MKITVVNINTLTKGDIFSWSLNMKKKCRYDGFDKCIQMCVYTYLDSGIKGYSLPHRGVCITN